MEQHVHLVSARTVCRELGISNRRLRAEVAAGRIPVALAPAGKGGRALYSLAAIARTWERQGEMVAERAEDGAA